VSRPTPNAVGASAAQSAAIDTPSICQYGQNSSVTHIEEILEARGVTVRHGVTLTFMMP
jgi:hypothetical protein